MIYIRYHRASGATDLRIRVPSPELLSPHEAEGYSFIALEREPPENCHVDHEAQEVFDPQVIESTPVALALAVGETLTLSGLPRDAWLREGVSEPVQVAENGSCTFSSDAARSTVVQVVGRYTGPRWHLSWMDLEAIKSRVKNVIDRDAEAARQRVITPGEGQAMTYLRKADAARLLLAGQPISAAQAQRIKDEAERLGCDEDEAATVIVNLADRWEALDAQIDNMRLTSKAQVDAATSGAAIQSVLDALSWPA